MILLGYPDAAPVAGFAGGAMIGIAAAIMLLGAGRIAGVSGILGRAIWGSGPGMTRTAAWAFVIGLPLGAAIATLALGGADGRFANPVVLVVAGLIVGVGTRLGSGCTSGHGVCGVSRLSPRSIVATLVFMTTGIATVAAMNAFGIEMPR